MCTMMTPRGEEPSGGTRDETALTFIEVRQQAWRNTSRAPYSPANPYPTLRFGGRKRDLCSTETLSLVSSTAV
jgi:hypothetical protein